MFKAIIGAALVFLGVTALAPVIEAFILQSSEHFDAVKQLGEHNLLSYIPYGAGAAALWLYIALKAAKAFLTVVFILAALAVGAYALFSYTDLPNSLLSAARGG